MSFDPKKIEKGVRLILTGLGLDTKSNPHLKDTPARVARAYTTELLAGINKDPEEVINTFFDETAYDEMITVANIGYVSFCAHHMLPFTGVVHVGYLPNGKIVGLSKIPRCVQVCAARLTTQEKLTNEIAEAFYRVLKPHGVGVIVEGSHSCCQYRGARAVGSKMITSTMLGTFRDNASTKNEFLQAIRSS